MNMHCLVAVARCRVQTRRYHCLINHTQFHYPPYSAIHPLRPFHPLNPQPSPFNQKPSYQFYSPPMSSFILVQRAPQLTLIYGIFSRIAHVTETRVLCYRYGTDHFRVPQRVINVFPEHVIQKVLVGTFINIKKSLKSVFCALFLEIRS